MVPWFGNGGSSSTSKLAVGVTDREGVVSKANRYPVTNFFCILFVMAGNSSRAVLPI